MFIDLLLTNPEQRQLRFLEMVRQQQRIEFTEISKLLDWPYISTQQVYRRVLANYEAITGETLSKDELASKCDWVNRALTTYFVRHSVGYQCLVASLQEQVQPVLNVSGATMSKRLKPIAAWLEERGIHFDPQSNHLSGDERLIRIFGWLLLNIGGETLTLDDKGEGFVQSLGRMLPQKITAQNDIKQFIRMSALRLSKDKRLSQDKVLPVGDTGSGIVGDSQLPAQTDNLRFDLAEIYWMQYMVTYSPYFVDTKHTKLVKPKEKAAMPYLINLVVKTVIVRMKIYRSPLYFEALQEYLMECLQFALLVKTPVLMLNDSDERRELPQLRKIVEDLVTDIPELASFSGLIVTELSRNLMLLLPDKRVEVGYPIEFDDYLVGLVQQQLMTKFIEINWQFVPLPMVTEVQTPAFKIKVDPQAPMQDEYFWTPWMAISDNIDHLSQKVQNWLRTVDWQKNEK